jgi:ubiquitin-like-conjugating enzyme ATG3
VTRNVPCPTRASTMENSVAMNEEDTAQIDDECGVDDWLVSRIISPQEQQRRIDEKLEEEFDILDEEGETVQSSNGVADDMDKLKIGETENYGVDEDEGDEYADMEEFEDENVMEDEAATVGLTSEKFDEDNNLIKVRTYDLSITYDKYYQTPRVWMMGYASSDSSQPLTGREIMEDVMTDYANRTVTIDPHPHVAGPHASIHPCQHGAVMKTIVRNLTKTASGSDGDVQANAPTVEMYLFIFLKFVSSIIPTINYDFTMEVTVSTKK